MPRKRPSIEGRLLPTLSCYKFQYNTNVLFSSVGLFTTVHNEQDMLIVSQGITFHASQLLVQRTNCYVGSRVTGVTRHGENMMHQFVVTCELLSTVEGTVIISPILPECRKRALHISVDIMFGRKPKTENSVQTYYQVTVLYFCLKKLSFYSLHKPRIGEVLKI